MRRPQNICVPVLGSICPPVSNCSSTCPPLLQSVPFPLVCLCHSALTRLVSHPAEESRPVDHCQAGSHDCDIPQRAFCSYTGGSAFVCSCLPGFVGDGRVCQGESTVCQLCVCVRPHGSRFTSQARSMHLVAFAGTASQREISPKIDILPTYHSPPLGRRLW